MTNWVVPVRKGENEELRYAIRTWVRNGGLGKKDRLIVVGHLPQWLVGVEHLPGNLQYDAARNVYDNVRIACEAVEGEVVMMNDDFFLIRPVDVRAVRYRGTLDDHLALTNPNTGWGKSLLATKRYLASAGITDPLSYDLHRPLLVETKRMAEVLEDARDEHPLFPPQWRTLYGNMYDIGGTQALDGKVSTKNGVCKAHDVLSTTDEMWAVHPAAASVRRTFTKPSPYERD